jgi:energy-coupling factor transporter ATP-binding protein EcfA2
MLLSGRPLYDNQADAAMFAHPPEWNPLVRALEKDLNVLLLGPPGSGKTTLLHQIQLLWREHEDPVVFVDGTGAVGVVELAARIRHALVGPPSAIAAAGSVIDALGGRKAPPGGASLQMGAQLQAIAEAPPTLILVDGPSSPDAIFDLFGRMRDVLWQQEHRWVVGIDARDRGAVLKPPADAFFDFVISLEKWSTNALADLLSRRAEGKLAGQLLAAAAGGAEGSPRQALRALSYGVVHDEDPRVLSDARGRLLEEATRLGRPASMLLAELLDRGQASPSDGDLQETLGVTRARLTQLFHQLAEHKLVVGEPERASGPGRPRIVYRPALPS